MRGDTVCYMNALIKENELSMAISLHLSPQSHERPEAKQRKVIHSFIWIIQRFHSSTVRFSLHVNMHRNLHFFPKIWLQEVFFSPNTRFCCCEKEKQSRGCQKRCPIIYGSIISNAYKSPLKVQCSYYLFVATVAAAKKEKAKIHAAAKKGKQSFIVFF